MLLNIRQDAKSLLFYVLFKFIQWKKAENIPCMFLVLRPLLEKRSCFPALKLYKFMVYITK